LIYGLAEVGHDPSTLGGGLGLNIYAYLATLVVLEKCGSLQFHFFSVLFFELSDLSKLAFSFKWYEFCLPGFVYRRPGFTNSEIDQLCSF